MPMDPLFFSFPGLGQIMSSDSTTHENRIDWSYNSRGDSFVIYPTWCSHLMINVQFLWRYLPKQTLEHLQGWLPCPMFLTFSSVKTSLTTQRYKCQSQYPIRTGHIKYSMVLTPPACCLRWSRCYTFSICVSHTYIWNEHNIRESREE